MRLYTGGRPNSKEGLVGVYLKNMSEESVRLVYGFRIKYSEGRDVPAEHTEAGAYSTWGSPDFAKRSDLLSNLVAGVLILEVQLRRTGSNNPSQPFIAENPFNDMMLKMFMDEESADVVFEVEAGDQQVRKTRQGSQSSVTQFHAHRIILQRCSPMLAEHCGLGVGLTSVPITGVKPEIFRHVLYYVYGGMVDEEDLKSHAKEIIDAADRFSVVNLKLEAEACYVKSTTISADNMMELLLYADSMNCVLLKEAVMDYIVENDVEVIKNVSLKDVPQGLFADLLTSMARGRRRVQVKAIRVGNSVLCVSATFVESFTRMGWTLMDPGKRRLPRRKCLRRRRWLAR